MNLRIPGPTPLPPETIAALSQQMIDHRGPQFEAMFREITEWLKGFFETEQDVFVLTCSGTGGMEAAIVNTLSPGDKVLAAPMGVFGERFFEIAKAFGAEVTRLETPMGSAVAPEKLGAALAEQGPYKAVLLTQNETSTGVTNDLEALSQVIQAAADPAPLILVDAISGLGAIRLPMDAWGIDVVVSGSQKAWMAPPGLAFVGFGERAWEAYGTASMPRHYFDLSLAKRYAERGQTPTTPCVPALFGLHVSLRKMVTEGMTAILARHERIGAYCRQRALDLGLKLYADPAHYSNTVTAVILPPALKSRDVLRKLREDYDIICGSTKDPQVDMIRIGHMGYVSEADIDAVFDALAEILAGKD
ncbi:MAG: alanine--glyoxylate aminotransferase family protein [Anaerolineae bacterium]|nr:alanine--glyoxylate aminotransferase family protein [Anaerolineae bacterium]